LGRHYGSDAQNWPQAILSFRSAVALHRDSRTLAYLANALEAGGAASEARPLYLEAVRLAPCQAVALAGLARLGAADLEAVRKCKPRDPVLLGEAATLLISHGRTAEAVRALEQVRILATRDAALAYRLYRAYLRLGNLVAANEALRVHRVLRDVYDQ
jgi:Flp pilus assembly protein TadD